MRRGERGFSLIGLLFLVAGLGVAMSVLGTVWHTAAQREKEKELLFVGEEYRHAITSFWRASPSGQPRLPKTLNELLLDPRFPNKVRHLRRLYADPVNGGTDWGLVKDEAGGIAGVYSLSERKPLKQAGFRKSQESFEQADSYQKWVFLFQPDQVAGGASAVAAALQPPVKVKP